MSKVYSAEESYKFLLFINGRSIFSNFLSHVRMKEPLEYLDWGQKYHSYLFVLYVAELYYVVLEEAPFSM